VGQSLLLSPNQVSYCLSQGIRIQGAEKAVNAASEAEVKRFQALVDDYKPRCNSRIHPDFFPAIKKEVEAQRTTLELKGAALIRTPAVGGSADQLPPFHRRGARRPAAPRGGSAAEGADGTGGSAQSNPAPKTVRTVPIAPDAGTFKPRSDASSNPQPSREPASPPPAVEPAEPVDRIEPSPLQ
jgi:hypothetical protein